MLESHFLQPTILFKAPRMLEGHTSFIYSLQLLLNGILASSSNDFTIKLWDIKTGQCRGTLQSGGLQWTCLQALQDGRLVSGANNGQIYLWDVESGQHHSMQRGHSSRVYCLLVLQDGTLVSCSADGTIKRWNIETGQCCNTLDSQASDVRCLEVLRDGTLVIGSEHTIKLWNLSTGLCTKTLVGHSRLVTCLQVLQDGTLVSGSADRTIRLWDIQTGQCRAIFRGHVGEINCLQVLQDGTLISGSADGTIKLWNIQTGQCIKTLTGHTQSVTCLQLLSNDSFASSSSDNTIKLWDIKTIAEKHCDWILAEYVLMLESSSDSFLETLTDMFRLAPNLLMFRLPYTIAMLYRQIYPEVLQEKLDRLLVDSLYQAAQHHIVHPSLHALFTKVILTSAEREGVLDTLTHVRIEALADAALAMHQDSADEQFKNIERLAGYLCDEIVSIRQEINNIQNAKRLAQDLRSFKDMIKKQVRHHIQFGIAKLVLNLMSIQAINPILEGVGNFSDILELSNGLFSISATNVSALSEALADTDLHAKVANSTFGHSIKAANFNLEEFIETWRKTVIELQSTEQADSKKTSNFITGKEASTQTTHQFFKSYSSPSPTSVEDETKVFKAWLNDVKVEGNFATEVDSHQVIIKYSSQTKTPKQVESMLFKLEEYLRPLFVVKAISLTDKDIEENKLILTAKTNLDAKKLNKYLLEEYDLASANVLARQASIT